MSFEANKIIMAVLIALLISMVGSIIGGHLVRPTYLAKNIYTGPELIEESAGAKSASQEEQKLESIEPLLVSANIDNGKNVAKKCLQCHTFEKGGPNKIGPNLWNTVGAKIAHVSGFNYSQAFKDKGGEWSYKALNEYLYKPNQYIPGTKMAFAGVRKAQDRADLIAYLRTVHDNPPPLPQK